MKRPMWSRFWLYKPDWAWDWEWIKHQSWKFFTHGSDEFLWHTWMVGFPWTGRVIFAHKPCPIEGCFTEEELKGLKLGGFDPTNSWPIDSYGFDHTKSDLENAFENPDLYELAADIYEDFPEEWEKYHAERCPHGEFCSAHQPGTKID